MMNDLLLQSSSPNHYRRSGMDAHRRWKDQLEAEFPLLLRKDGGMKVDLPRDIDPLTKEIGKVFRRASTMQQQNDWTPFGTLAKLDQKITKDLLYRIAQINNSLDQVRRSGELKNGAPMLLLFHHLIATPENIRALLNMMDADLFKGYVRCFAFTFLRGLTATTPQIWRLKLKNTNNRESGGSSSFAASVISTYFKALMDNAKSREHKTSNLHDMDAPSTCSEQGQVCVCEIDARDVLYNALVISKESPVKTMKRIECFEWQLIFKEKYDAFEQVKVFMRMHDLAKSPLEKEDVDGSHEIAKGMLMKLGSCDEVLRAFLRKINSGEVWSRYDSLMTAMGYVHSCLVRFFNCLTPLPDDYEMDALIRHAHAACLVKLKIATRPSSCPPFRDHTEYEMSTHMFQWNIDEYLENYEDFKHETDKQRWKRFQSLLDHAIHCDPKESRRKSRQDMTMVNLSCNHEMCANCFKEEEEESNEQEGDGSAERKKLMCGGCRRISYCSRECQKEHWNKGHREQCIGKRR